MDLPCVNGYHSTLQINADSDASHTDDQILRYSYFHCEFRLIWLTYFAFIIAIFKKYVNMYCLIFWEIFLIGYIGIFE